MLVRLLFIWMFLVSAQVLASGDGMYIHTDGLGSPVAKSDKNGNYIAGSRTRYEPYGATAAGATPTIGFTGHVNDPATGLVYMQQRYYDPYAGRFLSTDPVLTDADTGRSFNRYIYANNNPYKYIDPDGRDSIVSKIIKAIFTGKPSPKPPAQSAKPAAKTEANASAGAKKPPNPNGQNGKQDHQDKVKELSAKAEKETKPGEQVIEGKKINAEGSTRRPDVQIVDETGKTRKIFEAERRPNSARNINREAEYDKLGIEHETHKVGK